MKNLNMTVKGNKLTIEVDLKGDTEPSKTGKTDIVASSGGSAKIEGTDFIANISIYKKRAAK